MCWLEDGEAIKSSKTSTPFIDIKYWAWLKGWMILTGARLVSPSTLMRILVRYITDG
jgi:hypothetical protein